MPYAGKEVLEDSARMLSSPAYWISEYYKIYEQTEKTRISLRIGTG